MAGFFHKGSLDQIGFFRPLKQGLFGVFLGLKSSRAFLEFSGPWNDNILAFSGPWKGTFLEFSGAWKSNNLFGVFRPLKWQLFGCLRLLNFLILTLLNFPWIIVNFIESLEIEHVVHSDQLSRFVCSLMYY